MTPNPDYKVEIYDTMDDDTVITDNRSTTKKTQHRDEITTTTAMSDNYSTDAEDNDNYKQTEAANNIICNKHWGIGDAGATGTFLLPGAPVKNLRAATTPLKILLPDGGVIKSTHQCHLDIPWLPNEATKAHIVPGLAHTSLISIKQLCDNGCTVVYDKLACKVYFKHQLVWLGQREPKTGLWILPLQPNRPTEMTFTPDNIDNTTHQANSAYTMTSKGALINFLHQCAFSPAIPTWIKAIDNGQFATWPGLTSKAVRKYMTPSPATDKGHMKRMRQNVRSTKIKQQMNEINEDINPPQELMTTEKTNHVFCFAAIADLKQGTIYVDNTGKFPVRSLEGHMYVFVMYDYTTNAILIEPLRSMESQEFVTAFRKKITYLKKRGFTPQFNVIDNIVSTKVKEFLAEENIEVQIVEPHNHRVNAAERAIQTFKDHFIAGLCTVDKQFPIQLWDQLLEQAQDSLNMLRTSRTNPKLSAYHILEGIHDFNRSPWAPPGTRAVIYEPPERRQSWAPRGIDGWYVGPAKMHYRCYRFYIPATGGYRTSSKVTFYPKHCNIPIETPMDTAVRAAKELSLCIQCLTNTKPSILSRHHKALKELSDIFQSAVEEQNSDNNNKQEKRVENNPVAT